MKAYTKNRCNEENDYERLAHQLSVLNQIKEWVILSGGWAWHFMSPPHKEYKHLHDHKDIDIFVEPNNINKVILKLKELGFNRIKTKYDNNTFIRYENIINDRKIVIDMFFKEVPSIICNEWKVVEPSYLLSLYDSIHQTKHCVAVIESNKLIKKGIDPCNKKELINLSIL
jgi:hypothetical protein